MTENISTEQSTEVTTHTERRNGREAAILTLNLDLNDLDHPEDELLKQVADRIHQRLRASDIVVQLEGNEFIVLLKDIHTPENANTVTHELVDVITKPLEAGQEGDKAQTESAENRVKVEISFFPQGHGNEEENA